MNAGRKAPESEAAEGSGSQWTGYGNEIPDGPEAEDDEYLDGVSCFLLRENGCLLFWTANNVPL